MAVLEVRYLGRLNDCNVM